MIERVGFASIAIAAIFGNALAVQAQIPPTILDNIEDSLPPASDINRPQQPSETPLVEPVPVNPPSDLLGLPCNLPPAGRNSRLPNVRIATIRTEGNTILSLREKIDELLKPYDNQIINFETVRCLTDEITKIYLDARYIPKDVFVPDQVLREGNHVIIQVDESFRPKIEIEGLTYLQEAYVRNRLERVITTPLHLPTLDDTFALLSEKPFFERIAPELILYNDGSGLLRVEIEEALPFRPRFSFDNRFSPSTGAIQGNFLAQFDNLVGWGDRLSMGVELSEGANTYNLGYNIPVNPLDGILSVRYARGDSRIIRGEIRDFGIRVEEEQFSFGFRQPLYQTPKREFALGLTFDVRRNQTFIFDDLPFSLTPGADGGLSRASVLRFSQEWHDRGQSHFFGIRSQFSFGLDLFDATVNNIEPDGMFFSWQGDLLWAKRLSPRDRLIQASAIARLSAQLTPHSLLSLESASLGGINNLKGYRPGLLSGDNGIWGSLEVPISFARRTGKKKNEDGQNENEQPEARATQEYLQIVPSIAIGTVWNNNTPNPNPSTLASLGLGLRWQIIDNLFVHLDYGIPLVTLENRGSSLQDRGLFFALRYEF